MTAPDLQSGDVIEYPYLWDREAAKGETEGRKFREVAVGVRLPRADGDAIILLPITSQPPRNDQVAVEIPDIEKRRAGLDAHKQLWLVLDEYNYDLIDRSFYLEPVPPKGSLSRKFLLPVLKQFAAMTLKREVRRG